MEEKSWRQDHEAAGHTAPIVKKPREMNSSAYAFSLSVGDSRLWNSVTHIQDDTQCSVKPFGNILIDTSGVFYGIAEFSQADGED